MVTRFTPALKSVEAFTTMMVVPQVTVGISHNL